MPPRLRETTPWILALTATALSVLFPLELWTFAPWIFLSSALLLGVPHGACDPWIPGWVLHRPSRPSFLVGFFIIYLSLSALYLVLWRVFPIPSTLFFLLLTAWHWGSADASLEFHPGIRWFLFSISRGSLVMLAPFAFHFPEAWQVVQLMAPGTLDWLHPYSHNHHLFFLIAVFLSLLLQAFSRPHRGAWIETLVLLLLFYFTPPLLSVGIYFMAFHAWRHLLRLGSLRDQLSSADLSTPWIKSVSKLLLLSCPLTLATLIFLPWIPSLVRAMPANQNWVGPYLILLAVLTLPHAILVGWVDKKRPFLSS